MKRIIGLALLILALIGTVNFVRKLSSDDAAPPSGSSAYDSGKKAGKFTAPVVLVALGIFGLKLLLSSDDERPAAPVRRTPGSAVAPGQPALRGGQDTFASNPARLKLNAGAWLAANPAVIAVIGGVTLAGVVVLFLKPVAGIALLVTAGIVFYRAVQEAKQKFFAGDVCPGVVLSAAQNLVAVFTDLKAGGNLPRPAIKILKQPLNRMTAEPAYDGMRVAAAALYHGNVQAAAWQNFSPEVIHCVVADPEEIARVVGSISESEWQALDGWLAHIPVAKPALYKLWEMNLAVTGEAEPAAPAKPWFKTIPAIIAFSVVGAIFGLVLLAYVIGTIGLHRMRQAPANPTPPRYSAPAASGTLPSGVTVTTPTHAGNPSNAPMPTPPLPPETPPQVGAFAVGSAVQANWAGGWIPGTITKINYGGHSMMVKLNDARFPYPIVLNTNQLRLK